MCSMISGQCDKLRETADRLDNIADVSTPWVHCKLTPMLRDAADLILELRDDLQQANAENENLREERDMYRDLVDCMVHPDIPDQLAAENAALRTQLSDVTESMGRVEERCAKLRELCRDMFTTISWCNLDCYPSDNKKREYADRMRELGVDVDDSV